MFLDGFDRAFESRAQMPIVPTRLALSSSDLNRSADGELEVVILPETRLELPGVRLLLTDRLLLGSEVAGDGGEVVSGTDFSELRR